VEVAAGVVADFTRVPNAAAIIRGGWQGLAGIAGGRPAAYGLDAEGAARAMLAGTLSMTLDVAETAASLFHVRAVAAATGRPPGA
jgi:carbohydrate-binding DOMON domain-containing protein